MQTIAFDQRNFINYLNQNNLTLDPTQLRQARRIMSKFNGLCDIICNHITDGNLLSDPNTFQNYHQIDNIEDLIKYAETHIISINSLHRFFQLILVILFDYYPESPLSWHEQKAINTRDSVKLSNVITTMLDSMQVGDYYKFCTAQTRFGLIIGGHSMLIYKENNDSFICFDPNNGAKTKLDTNAVIQWVENKCNPQEKIVMMNNKTFLSKHHGEFIKGLKEQIAAQNTYVGP